MDWLVTKGFKHDKNTDTFIEDISSSLVGLSELSGSGSHITAGTLSRDDVQRAIHSQSYSYTFKIFNSDDDLLVEGICDGISAAPLLSINRELYQFDIEYIQFLENGQVVDVLLTEDELDMSMEED